MFQSGIDKIHLGEDDSETSSNKKETWKTKQKEKQESDEGVQKLLIKFMFPLALAGYKTALEIIFLPNKFPGKKRMPLAFRKLIFLLEGWNLPLDNEWKVLLWCGRKKTKYGYGHLVFSEVFRLNELLM